MFEFNQNEGMKIDVPADDNLLFFSNSFAIDQPLNGLVTRSNAYAQKVINSSQPLRRQMKLSQKSGTCCHASMQVLLVLGSIVQNKLFKPIMTRERFTLVMQFLHFGEEPVNEDDSLGKISSS